MPLAERLPSKFHSCPQSFASRPTVHFSDNLSTSGIALCYTIPGRGLFAICNYPVSIKECGNQEDEKYVCFICNTKFVLVTLSYVMQGSRLTVANQSKTSTISVLASRFCPFTSQNG